MHKFFETLMFYFDIMFSQMPINMKITFLLLGTHDQRFASVTLLLRFICCFVQCMGIL